MKEIIMKILDFAMTAGLKLVGAVLVVALGFVLTNKFVKLLEKSKGFERMDKNAQVFLLNCIAVVLKVIIVLTALAMLNIPMTNIVALIGSCGLAVGLALQGSLSNFAGGIMLLIFKPFKNGDFIESNGVSGSVQDVTILYTHLKTPDGKIVVVPNGTLSNATVTNYSADEKRRVDIEIGVDYSTDLELAKNTMLSVAFSCEKVMRDPEPAVNVSSYGDSSINLKMFAWCETGDYWDVMFYINNNLKARFDEKNISIPFPQVDVHIAK